MIDSNSSASPDMSPECRPKLSGWLIKRGHLLKNWKKRWFVLDGPLLKYYKVDTSQDENEPPTADSAVLELKGCITLLNGKCRAIAPEDAGGKPFAFQILPSSKKVFVICSADEKSRSEWVDAIRANTAAPTALSGASPSTSTSLADFELLRVVGRGTYGKVMQVRNKSNGDILAMKVQSGPTALAADPPPAATLSQRIGPRTLVRSYTKFVAAAGTQEGKCLRSW